MLFKWQFPQLFVWVFSYLWLQSHIYALRDSNLHSGWLRFWNHVSFLIFNWLVFLQFWELNWSFFYWFELFGWDRQIIPYIRKYGKNPVTGAPLKLDDLIPLAFHKNSEGITLFFVFITIHYHALFACNWFINMNVNLQYTPFDSIVSLLHKALFFSRVRVPLLKLIVWWSCLF